jgi:hypothetical protein
MRRIFVTKTTILVWRKQMWVGLVSIYVLNERILQINSKEKHPAPGLTQERRLTFIKLLFP